MNLENHLTAQKELSAHLSRTSNSVLKVQEKIDKLDSNHPDEWYAEDTVEAMALHLQGAYTGFEAVIMRILKSKGVRFSKSEAHHKEIFEAAVSNGILPADAIKPFADLLRFRHFSRNVYGVELRHEEVIEKGRTLCSIWPSTEKVLSDCIAKISPSKDTKGESVESLEARSSTSPLPPPEGMGGR